MYTILTTHPNGGSRNVGDKLIEQRLKAIVAQEQDDTDFLTVFREDPLEEWLDKINQTRAVLLPACPIRDTPMYPGTYRLVDDLSRIRVPMIPIGANWNIYPGDAQSRRDLRYSDATIGFLKHISQQVASFSCREHFTCSVLKKHGITNTIMTGDPAMFRLESLGQPMKRPKQIERLVFSPPLSPYYAEQAGRILEMLAELFPHSERICAFHLADATTATDKGENSAALRPEVAEKNRRVQQMAEQLDFQIYYLAGDGTGLNLYDLCDLHVGYECHAHLYFLSARTPSVLLAEDARGTGFNATIGIGGFRAFTRAQLSVNVQRKTITSGYCTSIDELSVAPPRGDLHVLVKEFLQDELTTRFRRFIGVAPWLDQTYTEVMGPFVRSLP